jgi:oxygen-independent coproporphyrinogen-3 oxidase
MPLGTTDASSASAADDDWRAAGFGVYVHWPFCASKCPYCDFNSHVAGTVDHVRWKTSYLSEIKRISQETGPRTVSTVFFGGGTPSLMEPDTVAAVLEAIRTAWPVANDLEVTMEANPGSVEAGRFRAFREAGVSRVSLGVQALNDADLQRLGRTHSAKDARAALGVAQTTFERVSFDLIYARQDQTVADWRAELAAALALAADHLSLYQLTVEDGTAFADRLRRGGLKGLPTEDRSADLWDVTQEMTEAAGLVGYETSNHARTGSESRHNLIYWRSGDWAGIGPGAHGRLTLNGRRWATEAIRAPGAWLDAVARQSHGEASRDEVGRDDQASEFLMMGLRLREGVDLDRWSSLSGGRALSTAALEEHGLVERAGQQLRTTRSGRPVLNAVLRELLTPLG